MHWFILFGKRLSAALASFFLVFASILTLICGCYLFESHNQDSCIGIDNRAGSAGERCKGYNKMNPSHLSWLLHG